MLTIMIGVIQADSFGLCGPDMEFSPYTLTCIHTHTHTHAGYLHKGLCDMVNFKGV